MVEPLEQLLCLPAVEVCVENVALVYLPANRWLFYRNCYLHAYCSFFYRFSAVLDLVNGAHLLALLVDYLHFLLQPAHLYLGTKDCRVISPECRRLDDVSSCDVANVGHPNGDVCLL